ncbi:MAG: hypothetical protein FWH47_01925 [Methanomassiliicoccaceae archaeon]|nr:hypothetical protein [Methanomassiliicoccaceae archaeon]
MTETSSSDSSFKFYCYRCGHLWLSGSGRPPKMCPRCKSSQWKSPVMKDAVCKKCGNEWRISKIDEPCPKCGLSGPEDVPSAILRCNQCDHEWARRSVGKLPDKCPVCKTTKWNEERRPQHSCRICGHVWRAKAERPKKCPKCQSGKWDAPVYKLQCRRCGHKWMAKAGRTSEDVRMCPSCKSPKWKEVPKPIFCKSCGTYYISRSQGSHGRCPSCNSKASSVEISCSFCKAVWSITSHKKAVCPRCGKPSSKGEREKMLDIWSDGRFSLRYAYADDFGFVYLWEGDIPVAAMYFHDLLIALDINAEQFAARMSNPAYEARWKEMSDRLYEHRDDYIENVPYFIKRLGLCRFDAEVLAIHFTGMGPEAIAIKFGIPIDDVRRSFDRIMAAYTDNGIIVNDSIFTDDPFSLY